MAYSKLPPIRVHLFGYFFSPSWFSTLVSLILCLVFIHLGLWQLERAAEKRLMENDFARQAHPLSLANISNPTDRRLRYQHLSVNGYFDNNHLIFIDNKVYQHQVGYYVLTPFIIPNNNKVLFVNRGFIASKNRQTTPSINKLEGMHTIKGLIYFPNKSFLLAKEDTTAHWPLISQTINLKKFAHFIEKDSYPFYLLEQGTDDAGLIRDWHPVQFPSYRHTGYAVQWFLLALTLFIIYLSLNTSRAGHGCEKK